MSMKVRTLPGGKLGVALTVSVSNPKKNEDKMVSLVLEVLNGDEVVAKESVAILPTATSEAVAAPAVPALGPKSCDAPRRRRVGRNDAPRHPSGLPAAASSGLRRPRQPPR